MEEIVQAGRPIEQPDGGYGWFIVFGCFVVHFIFGGFSRSSGIYFLQFRERYGKNSQLTAWPLSISSAVCLLLAPVASAINSKYSARAALMIGGPLMSIGLILTALSDNFYLLFVYFSGIYGLGTTLCYTPAMIIINLYFNKKRSLAVGLGTSGMGIGTFVLVPIIQFLFDTYGFYGALLIQAGIALHMVLVAMIFRPLFMHQRFTASKIPNTETSSTTSNFKTNDSGNINIDNLDNVDKYSHKDKSPQQTPHPKTTERKTYCGLNSVLEIVFPVDISYKNKETKRKLFECSLLKDVSFLMYCMCMCLFGAALRSSIMFLPALMKAKDLSEDEAALVISASGVSDTLSRVLTGMAFDYPKLRPIRSIIFNGFLFVVAGITFTMPSLRDFWSFVAIICIYSLFIGAYIGQKSVILVDILGVENMANSFGILNCFQGFGILIGPPASGFMIDQFGTYDCAFYVCGGCMLAASFLMLVSNLFLKIKQNCTK